MMNVVIGAMINKPITSVVDTTTSTTFVTYVSSQNNNYLKFTIMKKEDVAAAAVVVDSLGINNDRVNFLLKEMLCDTSYRYTRLKGILLGTRNIVTKDDISLTAIREIMDKAEITYISTSVNIRSIDNLNGSIEVSYRKNESDTYNYTFTVYFDKLAKKDHKFNEFLDDEFEEFTL